MASSLDRGEAAECCRIEREIEKKRGLKMEAVAQEDYVAAGVHRLHNLFHAIVSSRALHVILS